MLILVPRCSNLYVTNQTNLWVSVDECHISCCTRYNVTGNISQTFCDCICFFLKLGSVIQFFWGVTHQFWPAHPLVSHNNRFTSMERSVQMDLAVFNQADGHLLNPDSQYVERKYLMWQQVLLSVLVFRLTFTGGWAKTHTIATGLDWISKNTRTCMLLCSAGK